MGRQRTQGSKSSTRSGDELVDLASSPRRRHIFDGEVRSNGSYGGGHRPGTGFPNKSEFPADCSDDRIMHEISDIATDPSLAWRAGNRPGDIFVSGTRDGIDTEVLIRNNQVCTGYPTNVVRNAP
ncbi:EndoU domain-containing protein [Phytoactinopolyspora alkaliphila]|uniref:EndoU domain-containing protein n=1 Tax=Phytoactinopolyspora alkaliphila TaxID=1783498 RepID=A0A6N9YQ90_9ACTN|nr:EndoU domain-containing protein [Phytoactinopolyspora alkaliphila]